MAAMEDEFSSEQNENDSHKSNSKRKNKRRIKKDQEVKAQIRLSYSTQASFLSGRFESSTMGSHFSGISEKENSQGMPPRIIQKSSVMQRVKA
jgi:hypothetical protein